MNFTRQERSEENEPRLLDAIATLFGDDQRLIDYVLDSNRRRLRRRAGILKEDAWRFSEEDQLRIRAALDIWSGSGHLQLWEILEKWGEEDWIPFLRAIRIWLQIQSEQED